MPHKIDTSSIKRINVYKSIIETAPYVPSTSQYVLNQAVSNMRLELSDLDARACNLIVTISLINICVTAACVFIGSVILMFIPPFLTCFVIVINNIREETVAYNIPTTELTEGSSNVPPFTPTTSVHRL